MSRARTIPVRPLSAIGVGLLVAAAAVVVSAPSASAESLTIKPTATGIVVEMRGNGHGHGMSQYGARGAAIAGKTYRQIVAFYYPSTTLTTQPSRIWRVRLSGAGTSTSIAAQSRTTVTGMKGYLPTAGIRRYRLIADAGTGLTLQKLPSAAGSTWVNVKTGLRNRAEFYRYGGVPSRLYRSDGTSTDYDGYLRAVRGSASGAAGGVYTVNRVNDDRYTAAVVPREMPASWQRAAVYAQAVAARTYAAYNAAHPASTEYDLCDTTSCQVYGGRTHFSSTGAVLWTNFDAAAVATSHQVLQYKNGPVFAQFSASDGGWTAAGGQPYLKAQADPYNNAASSDPYLDYRRTVPVKSIAAHYGLAKLTKIVISSRDGNGVWGGRALSGTVTGTDRAGKARTVSTTGFGLQDAFGAGTTWVRLLSATP
jgi:stage II sporulation protein D